MPKERISKILANCGVSSRRKSELLVLAGRVKANGKTVNNLFDKFCIDEDIITVDEKVIASPERNIYIALNKPIGFECSKSSSSRSVYNLIEPFKDTVFTVGRLDMDTSGLILLTNDGTFCNKVSHPSYCVTKEYIATVAGCIKKHHLDKIRDGTKIGRSFSKPLSVTQISLNKISIIVSEGKKHEVRLLVALSELELLALHRIQIGTFKIGNLPSGKWREISYKVISNYF